LIIDVSVVDRSTGVGYEHAIIHVGPGYFISPKQTSSLVFIAMMQGSWREARFRQNRLQTVIRSVALDAINGSAEPKPRRINQWILLVHTPRKLVCHAGTMAVADDHPQFLRDSSRDACWSVIMLVQGRPCRANPCPRLRHRRFVNRCSSAALVAQV
jgi:hypothetical protein